MAAKPPRNRNRNRYAFNPIILDQDKHEKRRVINQLPTVHQTETLQKFFGASADNLFDPGKGKSINGYVGQIPLWYQPEEDYYLAEKSKDREFYQLEASMVSKNSEGNVTNLLFYPDLINQIRFQGGLVNNHHRLFSQDFYTWCPPIDLDKILNFRQYVWLPTSDIAPVSTFEDGDSDGWVLADGTLAPVSESNGSFTRFLGRFIGTPDGAQVVSKSYALNASSTITDIEFDFLKIDSWDASNTGSTVAGTNERITVYFNGEFAFSFTPVGINNTGGNSSISGSFTTESFTGTYVVTSPTGVDSHLGFGTTWPDRIYHVAVTVNGTGETLKLGFGSTTNQSMADESLGIDNIKISQSSSTALLVYGPTVNYEADGVTLVYKLPGYEEGADVEVRDFYDLVMLKKSLIRAMVDGIERQFTYVNGSDQITFVEAPAEDAEIVISVYTDIENSISLPQADPRAFGGIKLSSSMRVKFVNDISSDYKPNDVYIVEGVGSSLIVVKEDANDALTSGSQGPDYLVMARGATNGNEWSKGNRWFHVSTLPAGLDHEYVSTLRATRPIIEFDRDLELYNYGLYRRLAVDAVSEAVIELKSYLNDNPTSVEFGNVRFDASAGELTITDLLTNEVIIGRPSARILMRNTDNSLVNERVYVLTNQNGVLSAILEADGMNPGGEPVFGEVIKVKYGTLGGKNLHWDGLTWKESQQKISANQAPLFTLYDLNGVSIDDQGLYPSSNFAGSKLFGFKVDSTGTRVNDPVLGFPLLHDNKGQILFENFLSTEVYSYLLANKRTDITGFYFHKVGNINPDLETLSNDWYKADYKSRQYMVDRFVADGKSQVFVISQEPAAQVAGEPSNLVVTVGRLSDSKNFERMSLEEDAGFIRLGRKILISSVQKGDIVEVKTFNPAEPPADATGFYEIPSNLQANPDNAEISDIGKGDFYEHFADIIRSQDGFFGAEYAINNYRDTAKIKNRGKFITQQSAGLLKTMLLASESQFDITSAIRFADSEYTRFKNKFQQKILEYSVKHRFSGPVTTDTWINTALEELNRGKTKEFPFYLSDMGVSDSNNLPSFIPATPSYLGVYPLYIPEMITDVTLAEDASGNAVEVEVYYVKGHDGSWTQGRNYEVAQVMLALEERIYLSVPDNIRNAERPVFDWQVSYSDQYRSNDYSYEEYLKILQPSFERWAVATGQDYRVNDIYNQQDPWTWNWSSVPSTDGGKLPGHWRGIYEKFFGTQRPDLTPWESLGFTRMPEWWTSRYGPAPYTSDNLLLWNDLEVGYIHAGPRQGINSAWARPGYRNHLPVNQAGQLLHPGSSIELDLDGIAGCGIAPDTPLHKDRAKGWVWGDLGPVEQDWRRSSHYPFAIANAGYLMKPAQFVELGWNTKDLVLLFEGTETEQLLNLDTMGRPTHQELQVHGELLDDFSLVKKVGIQQWISDYMISKNTAIAENFADKVRGLGVQLAYKVGGFTDSSTLVVVSDAFGRVPSEDIDVSLYRSPSIREESYSGIAVEYLGNGSYRVFGYDSLNPSFKAIAGDNNGNKTAIGESNKLTVVPNWRPNTYYSVNLTVKWSDSYYRCIKTHTSGENFERVFWIEVARPQYADGARVTWNLEPSLPIAIEEVSYGTVFKSPQALTDFINGYDRYLKSHGWVFEEVDSNNMQLRDWKQSVRDFITWSQDDTRTTGDFIALSPCSTTAKFVAEQGAIQPIEQIVNGVYAIVDQSGQPIAATSTRVIRNDGEVVVVCDSATSGIFGLRLYVSEYEHAIVFNNKTIFNDTIYSPLLNIRQPRLRIQGFRTVDWVGRIDAPGFIVTNNSLVPNFERAADDFRRFFDVESIENKKLQDRARANFGYEERDYLNNLLITPTNQFEFYQGMIQQKGSPTSMRRLLRSNFIRHNKGLKLFEEWAFRIGDYGGQEVQPSLDIMVQQSSVKHDPQMIQFKTELSAPAPQFGVIDVVDIKNANNKLVELDSKWAWRPDATAINWTVKDFTQAKLAKNMLPTAGYVKLDEVRFTAKTSSEFNSLYAVNNVPGGEKPIQAGDRAWVYGLDVPVSANGTVDPASWQTYKFLNTGFTVGQIIDDETGIQGQKIAFTDGQVARSIHNGADIKSSGLYSADSFYLSTTSEMFKYIPDYQEKIYIQSDSEDPASRNAFIPKFGGTRTVNFEQGVNQSNILLELNPEMGMWIKSIKVNVTEAFGSGSSLIIGTEASGKHDYYVQSYEYDERDYSDTINYNSPEQVVVATPEVHYVDQGTPVADVKLIRVGRVLDYCGTTSVEWYFKRQTDADWQTGGTLTFARPADAVDGDEDYYTQTVSVPINPNDRQTIQIRTVTLGTNMGSDVVNTTSIDVQRPAYSNLNFVDLTKVREFSFEWVSATPVVSAYATYPDQCVADNGSAIITQLTSLGLTGKLSISVEYFYTRGFELLEITESGEVPSSKVLDSTGGEIFTWIPTRYPNKSCFAQVADDTYLWQNGDIVEIDNDTTVSAWQNSEFSSTNNWMVLRYSNGWNMSAPIRRFNFKIASHLFDNAGIYDSNDNELKVILQTFDPVKGLIPGTADREIYYKLPYDPAVYNNTSAAGKGKIWGKEEVGRLWWDLNTIRYLDYEIFDSWTGTTHSGTTYRWKNWGRLAPGISADIYQWTRTTSAPADWSTQVDQANRQKSESYIDKPTGIVPDAINAQYVTAIEWNDDLQTEETVYYYWVKGCSAQSSTPGRKMTAQQVSNILSNPAGSGIPYFAVIDSNKVVIGAVKQFLNDQDTVLKIKWHEETPIINNHHKQWIILREEDERNTIEEPLWNKMRDSLVGWDTFIASSSVAVDSNVGSTELKVQERDAGDFSNAGSVTCAGITYYYNGKTGNTLHNLTPPSFGISAGTSITQTGSSAKIVPDAMLPKAQQLGALIRPRQSWFPVDDSSTASRPSRAARETFVDCMNDIFAAQPFLDQWVNWDSVFATGESLPTSDRYVTTALDLADLRLLVSPSRNMVQPDECVLIENTVEAGGFWTLWRLLQDGLDTSTRRFVLVDFQKWRMQEGELWNPSDWYATGWSAANFPNYRFPSYAARDAAGNLDYTLLKGTLVQIDVQSESDPRWSWDVYTSTTKYQVAKQNGTFKLSDAFYNENRVSFGNNEIYGPNGLLDPFRKDGAGNVIGLITPERIEELNFFVENRDGSRELEHLLNSFKNSLLNTLQKNQLFFTMVKSAFKQSKDIDWAFKTSFLYLGGYSEELRQSPVAFKDQIDNVISYLEEVKPYHVKIREYVRRLSYGPDLANLSVTDFDKPVYLDNGVYRQLDINNPTDLAILLANRPWKDWAQNYLKDSYDLEDWDESWNPIRRMNVSLLFDRVSCSTTKGWDSSPFDPPHTLYSQNNANTESLSSLATKYRGRFFWDEANNAPSTTPRVFSPSNRNPFNDTSVETIDERNRLVRDGIVKASNPGTIVVVTSTKSRFIWTGKVWIEFESQGWDQDLRSGMATRIEEAYEPLAGMARKDAPDLISGCDFDGTVITDVFQDGGWDQFEWDSTGLSSEYQDHTGRDLETIDGNTPGLTPASEILSDSDIKIDGNDFAQPAINGGRPEEMVHIRGRDSSFITVYQRSEADTIAAIPAFNAKRSQVDPTMTYMNSIRTKLGLPTLNSSYAPLSESIPAGHVTSGEMAFRLIKNLNNEFEKIKLETNNVSFTSWTQNSPEGSRGGEITITTADGVFPFHDPKNPSEEFLDTVRLSRAYRSKSNVNMSTPGNKTFVLRDVDNSGVLKEIPFNLSGNEILVVIENAKKPSQRALAKIVGNYKGQEVDNWDGTITVEVLNIIGDEPDNVSSKMWNILPLEAYNQPGVIWIGTSRFTYNEVVKDGNSFTLKNAFLSGNSLSNLTNDNVAPDGNDTVLVPGNITLKDTTKVFDGSILRLIG